MLSSEASPRRAADLYGLKARAVAHPAAYVKNNLTQRRTHRHFNQACVFNVPGQRKGFRTGACGGAYLFEPI
jgi:hypothetical protein